MPASLSSHGRNSRISITLRADLHDELLVLCQQEGRSLSNLCARLIEDGATRLRQAQGQGPL